MATTKLIMQATRHDTSAALEFQHPVTLAYVAGTLVAGTTDTFRVEFTDLPNGTYTGPYYARVVGTTITATTTVTRIIDGQPQTTVYGFRSRVATGAMQTGLVPLVKEGWYELNNEGNSKGPGDGVKQFSDGNTDTKTLLGYGQILPSWEIYYPFTDITNVTLKSLRLFGRSDTPCTVYARKADRSRVLLGTFNQSGANQQDFAFEPVQATALILVVSNYYAPNEIQVQGDYQAVSAGIPYPLQRSAFKRKLGINCYPWNFAAGGSFPQSTQVDATKLDLMQAFGGYRFYADWYRIENVQGEFCFDYTDGGWDFDNFARTAKQKGQLFLPCFQKVPGWLQDLNSRPGDQRDDECVPAPYGANWLDPASYALKARLGYYAAARWGRNTSLTKADLPLMKEGLMYTDWAQGPNRTFKVGLDVVNFLEPENERDKSWKQRKAYQTAQEHAAMMSAFYDGHRGTLGKGYGVKTADPTMQVVHSGTAGENTDYERGMIDWCIEHRGYHADGTVNLCWDIANYHAYPFSGGTQYSGTGAGVCPEQSRMGDYARAHVSLARQHGYAVWLTETGYDSNESSPLRAFAIGSKGVETVRADWALRSALLSDRLGLDAVFHYETYDQNFGGQFGTCGFLNDGGPRKAQGQYFFQAKQLLGDYVYQGTESESPVVSRYSNGTSTIYAIHMPTQTGATGTYTLPGTSAQLYTPQPSGEMAVTTLSGTLTISATETPVFVKVAASA